MKSGWLATVSCVAGSEDTIAPGFGDLGIANQVYTPGEEIAPVVLPAATDVVSTTEVSLTYQLSGLPSGLTFQESTRTLSGTPTSAQLATEYSYTATDEAGNRSAELTFMITVGDVVAVVVDLESSISVYPNPSETSFFITLPQSMPAKTVRGDYGIGVGQKSRDRSGAQRRH